MSLYQDIKNAGIIPYASRESDLQFKDTPESRNILNCYPIMNRNRELFRNQTNGEWWIEVPFAFDPFWENRQAK